MSNGLNSTQASRRRFIQATGALIFSAQCPVTFSGKAHAAGSGSIMNSFVRIDANNVITMMANNSEFGNGAYTVMLSLIHISEPTRPY